MTPTLWGVYRVDPDNVNHPKRIAFFAYKSQARRFRREYLKAVADLEAQQEART
jgi:hypothetical protein